MALFIRRIDPADLLLINAARNGDSRSFSRLVCKYERRVRALGMSFFKNVPDCDDFVQDVFIKVYTGLKSFRGESQFSTWLMRVAYNTAVNAVNRKREYESLPEEYELLDPSATAEEKELRSFTMQVVRETVAELPERFKMCVDMYFFYDMSYQEISDVTDLPVNTIKSHVFRAKKILKERLSKRL